MASIAASHNGIALLGAPDSSIGSAKPKIRPVQVMQLDLEGGWVDELLRAARNKSDIQLCFGPKPVRLPLHLPSLSLLTLTSADLTHR